MSTALIGIGSNLGDRRENVRRALELLTQSPGIEVVAKSRLYASKPIGGPHGQGDYVNAAAVLRTSLAPHALLKALQHVETQLGRTRSQRWAPRMIDLDLLLFDEEIVEDNDLILPHSRMSFRRFVLAPAAEIAPEMVYPVTASRIDELLARLDHGPNYVAIGGCSSFFSVGDQPWLARRLHYVLDCPLVPWESLGWACLGSGSTFCPSVMSLEFYRRCADALSFDRWNAIPELQPLLDGPSVTSVVGSSARPAVGSFWFEEWRFHACMTQTERYSPPPPLEYRQLIQALEDLSEAVLSPKFVIWLKMPAARSSKFDEQRACCLVEMFRQSPCGPLLRLDTDDRDWMLSESIAAIKAMQPLDGDVS
jgi:2-amino-4-hydroxy-6-hydroxymethyldihydropteridine diphosphokinase